MRFAIIRKAAADTEAGVQPSQALLDSMMAYMAELQASGHLIDGYGLKPSSQGRRLLFAGGAPTVVDGPFAETKELVAGISLIEAASLDEVVEIARRWPTLDGDGNVELEIRPLYEMEDFTPTA